MQYEATIVFLHPLIGALVEHLDAAQSCQISLRRINRVQSRCHRSLETRQVTIVKLLLLLRHVSFVLFVCQVAVNYKVAVAVIQAMRVVILSWVDSRLRS